MPLLMQFVIQVALAGATDERESMRAEILSQMNDPVLQELVFHNWQRSPERHRLLLTHYRQGVWKDSLRLRQIAQEQDLLTLALDRALYRDEEEKVTWQRRLASLGEAYSAAAEPAAYRRKLAILHKMTKGAAGSFVRSLHQEYRYHLSMGSRPEDIPIGPELNAINSELRQLQNHSPHNKNLAPSVEAGARLLRDYRAGKIDFENMVTTYRRINATGQMGRAADIMRRGEDTFNRAAILRTELARDKGLPTWASYQMALQQVGYAQELQSVGKRIDLLRWILKETRPLVMGHFESWKKTIPSMAGKTLEQMDHLEVLFLDAKQDSPSLDKYFPSGQAANTWKKTMLESGFPEGDFAFLSFDTPIRQGKNTHAYAFAIRLARPQKVHIDAATLDWISPARPYNRPIVHMVQNLYGDGLKSWATIFHEGGHAMDFLGRIVGEEDPRASYAYGETWSLFMENVLQDPRWLNANALKKGVPPLEGQAIAEYLKSHKVRQALALRHSLLLSLFELELWNAPFTKQSETFMERARRLHREHHKEFAFGRLSDLSPDIPAVAERFTTDHFTNGSISYIGYPLAHVAAEMVTKHLLDQLEAETGRRTLWMQPTLAKKLSEGSLQRGHALPFPAAIEAFTGKPYRIASIAEMIKEALSPDCSVLLK